MIFGRYFIVAIVDGSEAPLQTELPNRTPKELRLPKGGQNNPHMNQSGRSSAHFHPSSYHGRGRNGGCLGILV